MYTYKSFATDGVFTLLQPIQFTMLAVSLITLIFVLIPIIRKQYLNWLTLSFISAMNIVLSALVIFFGAILADEMNLGGDAIGLWLALGTCIVSLLALLIYFGQHKKGQHLQKPPYLAG